MEENKDDDYIKVLKKWYSGCDESDRRWIKYLKEKVKEKKRSRRN